MVEQIDQGVLNYDMFCNVNRTCDSTMLYGEGDRLDLVVGR